MISYRFVPISSQKGVLFSDTRYVTSVGKIVQKDLNYLQFIKIYNKNKSLKTF